MMIAVAMSGGVDSSTAAALLKNQGHELVGFSMQLWNQRRINVGPDGEPLPSRCCSLDDLYDARVVANKLGFPFYILNLEDEFERDVVAPFVDNYLQGQNSQSVRGVQFLFKIRQTRRNDQKRWRGESRYRALCRCEVR